MHLSLICCTCRSIHHPEKKKKAQENWSLFSAHTLNLKIVTVMKKQTPPTTPLCNPYLAYRLDPTSGNGGRVIFSLFTPILILLGNSEWCNDHGMYQSFPIFNITKTVAERMCPCVTEWLLITFFGTDINKVQAYGKAANIASNNLVRGNWGGGCSYANHQVNCGWGKHLSQMPCAYTHTAHGGLEGVRGCYSLSTRLHSRGWTKGVIATITQRQAQER